MRRLREIDPEPPSGTSGGHVEIVDFGEIDLKRRDGKPIVRRSLSSQERRVAVAVLAICLLGSASWAWAQPRASAVSSSPTPIVAAQTSGQATASAPASASGLSGPATPVAPETVPATPAATRQPLASVAGGWTVRDDVPMGSGQPDVMTGPDGTVYVSGAAPIDRSGNVRTGWLQTPDGEYAKPILFGPDGQIYGVTKGMDMAIVWGFRPGGGILYSFNLPSTVYVQMALAPGGIDIVVPGDVVPDSGFPDHLFVIDDTGALQTHWALDGSVSSGLSGPQFFVRPDGTIVVSVLDDKGLCSTHYLDQWGGELGPARVPCWDNLAQAPDGSILAQSCDGFVAGLNAYDMGPCLETTVAILDDMGRPESGWPHKVAGDLGEPVFDADSFVCFTGVDPDGGGTFVTMLRRDGVPLPGWPAALGPAYASAPVLGDGRLFVAVDSSVEAFAPDGTRLTGWPILMDGYIGGPVVYVSGSGGGALFFGTSDGAVAVGLDGQVLGTYVDESTDIVAWLGCVPVAGGVLAFSYHAGNNQAYVIAAFLPASGF
jgi:hypothetical protein